ncbi:CD209 antigen-like protein D [Thalassophryne amazonica]|uniref:CD209 antigen-like protein D n=1 Tax=Thalassophryne amazonica TaxID=390379 RepID=UPI00147237F5|nr:CD209 antigen-like protein D [Thalassophryne amazonica]
MADYINDEYVRNSRHTQRQRTGDTIQTERRLCKLAYFSFCLLCLLQAILNISLRLTGSEDSSNLSKERDKLQSSVSQLKELNYNLTQNMSQLETINRNLTREKNELQAQLSKVLADICTYGNRFDGSCYLFSITRKNWYDSKAECEKLGAHLVIITSEAEQNFTTSKISEGHWIGLTDEEEEDTWKWVNGEPLNTMYWLRGEPNNTGNNEDCVIILPFNSLRNWNDLNCQRFSRRWICEKEINQ